jgi:hypothetical protein
MPSDLKWRQPSPSGRAPITRGKSLFDAWLAWAAGAVIVADVFVAGAALASDCAALMGMLAWAAVAAAFVAAVLLPALVRRCLAPLGGTALRLVVVATVATALPAVLFSLQRYPHQDHCIA